jgi:cation diffusion facilitator CzcD-associated flavoprotein CzcO
VAADVSSNGHGTSDFRVAVIGTGFSGLGMAIRLKQEGIEDFVVFERASDIGGTWRDNDYPGCCCDIPSHVYSFSFELNPFWTRGFAPQWEIKEYLDRTAQKYGVLPHVRFDHEVLDAEWNDDASQWEIETTGGSFTAQVLVAAAGPLADPTVPDIPGLSEFEGKMFHSARWEHDHDLENERVAVIGTGASAIQFVPQIQPKVSKLHVFQRTAPWVTPRLDHQITDVEHWLLRHIPFAPRVVRWVLYWLLEWRVVLFRNPNLMQRVDRVARAHLKRQVKDPELREKLTPGYIMGCKRVLIADNYYPALTKPNVDLRTDGVEEIRSNSVVTKGGDEIEVDTIIFGTGFQVTDAPIAHRIKGRDGRSLGQHWDGSMQAYKGISIAGFPNLFFMIGPNTGLGHNSMVFMIESHLNYVIDALRTMEGRCVEVVEVLPEAQRQYNDELQAAMEGTVWTAGHCQSWYLDDTGRNTTLWPGWTFRFRQSTRKFDAGAYAVATRAREHATASTGG